MPTTTINKLGHRMGARGGRTRQALMNAGSTLLRERHFGAVRTAALDFAKGPFDDEE